MTNADGDPAAGALLATKLHAPRRRREIVPRARLNNRWTATRRPVLTLVSAPAGFGKSTLLTEWFASVHGSNRSTAWLSLDAGDNDPAVFGAYLLAALRSVEPSAFSSATVTSLQTITTTLINELHTSGREIVLVLDDYHVIDSAEIHEALTFLVDHAPSGFCVVLASRADPPLPLARWRARGDLLEIRAADLRFTRDEAASYLKQTLGFDLAPDDVGALEARTEGWIAALQLAALSMQGRDDIASFIDSFTGDDRFVVDYLVEEVLERQSPEVRDFLLRTAVLGRLTGPLCDAITGDTRGKAMLEALDRSNLFIVALDDARRWYRYHHLFADMLRARLSDKHPEIVAELHHRASVWHEQNGDTAEAVAHAMTGHHFELAARLIELAGPQLRQSRQERTLRGWLESLPHAVFMDRPVLSMGLVGARMATAAVNDVESLLQLVESALERSSPPIVFDHDMFAALPAQVAVQRAGLALLAGDLAATIAHASRALELIEDTDHLRRGAATALIALVHWTNGDLVAAERLYSRSIQALIEAGYLADMLGCSLALADIQLAQGRLTDATRTFETGLRWTTDNPGLRGAADMHVGLSEVFIERNDLDAATRHLATSTELGDAAGLPQHAYRWRVTRARLCRAEGNLDGALALLDEAAPLYDTDFSPPVRPVAALRARVQLARRDLAKARRWAGDRGFTTADDLSYVREFEHVTFARVLIARAADEDDPRLLDDARTLLARLLVNAELGGRTGSVIEIRILEATAHHAHGDDHAAIAALEAALRHADIDGHVRLFLHAGPAVTALLRAIAARDDAPRNVRAILAAATSDDAPASKPAIRPPTLVDELSPRELDVLRLLRSDLSGPDIARELIVSLNTVRTHTKSIYMKLGATNRREAIRRAADLGL